MEVRNEYFAWFLGRVHNLLDPMCAATARVDNSYGWAPCTTSKLLIICILHLLGFAVISYYHKRLPESQRMRKSTRQIAAECLLEEEAGKAKSTATRAPDSTGMKNRGGKP